MAEMTVQELIKAGEKLGLHLEEEILALIDTRIELHQGRLGRLNPATEDYQRLSTWHRASVEALEDLRREIVAHLPTTKKVVQ